MSAPVFIMTSDTIEPAGSPSRGESLAAASPSAASSTRPGSAPPGRPPASHGCLAPSGPGSGEELVLTGPEARHAVSVRRLREPERVDLVDGSGLRLRCTVTSGGAGGRDRLGVRVVERVQELAPPVRLVLVQALAKGGRDEQAVETATEVGVEAVLPWQARRCVSVWQASRRARGRQRWQATAREAAKQARRAVVPQVGEVRSTVELAAWVRSAVEAGGVVALLHEGAAVPLSSLLGDLPVTGAAGASPERPGAGVRPRAGAVAETVVTAVDEAVEVAAEEAVGEVGDGRCGAGSAAAGAEAVGDAEDGRPVLAVVVGPEGGIEEEETAVLEEAGAVAVRLGPHVMRTSSAGPLALAVLAQRAGLWEPAGAPQAEVAG